MEGGWDRAASIEGERIPIETVDRGCDGVGSLSSVADVVCICE